MQEVSEGHLKQKNAFLIIMGATVLLTWESDVYQIISLASRAFALFYALQCLVAFIVTRQTPDLSGRTSKSILFGGLTLACILVVVFGTPSGG